MASLVNQEATTIEQIFTNDGFNWQLIVYWHRGTNTALRKAKKKELKETLAKSEKKFKQHFDISHNRTIIQFQDEEDAKNVYASL